MADERKIDIDTDKLIQLVKDRPILWDKNVEGYRNHEVTKMAWDEVCRIMNSNYDEMEDEQRNEIGDTIKRKWTYLRDVWQKKHKRRREMERQGKVPKLNHQYIAMMFLEKVYQDVTGGPKEGLSAKFNEDALPALDAAQNISMVDECADTLPNANLSQFRLHQVSSTPSCSGQSEGVQPKRPSRFLSPENSSSDSELDQSSSCNREASEQRSTRSPIQKSNEIKREQIKREQIKRQTTDDSNQMEDVSNSYSGRRSVKRRLCKNTVEPESIQCFFEKSIVPVLADFDEFLMLEFKSNLIQLVKKMKYPDRV